MLINAPHLQEMFKSPPMASFRQPPNLRRLLCRAKLHPQDRATRLTRGTHQNAPGWKKCGKNCKICPYTLPNTKTVVGLTSSYTHEIRKLSLVIPKMSSTTGDVQNQIVRTSQIVSISAKPNAHSRTDLQNIEITLKGMS